MTIEFLMALCGRIRAIFPNALIGGGAVRDTFLGAPVKDIDVFVQCSPADFAQRAETVASRLGGQIVASNAYVHAPSYDIVVPGLTHPINLVWRDCSPLMDVGDYDFGICQIAVSDTEMFKTGAFMKDIADHTITYMHADAVKEDWHRKSSANRLVRILMKHPGFTVKNASLLQPLVDAAMPSGLGIQL